jgi:hypothetical protein
MMIMFVLAYQHAGSTRANVYTVHIELLAPRGLIQISFPVEGNDSKRPKKKQRKSPDNIDQVFTYNNVFTKQLSLYKDNSVTELTKWNIH